LEAYFKALGGVWLTISHQTFSDLTLCWQIIFFAPCMWWNVAPSINKEDLNSYYDSYAKITKVEICVA
jgi:hypothetical protein